MKTVCKVRGITLNYRASQVVNFETIKHLVLNGRSNSTVTVHTDKKIKRKRIDGACVSIVTEHEKKSTEYPLSSAVGETIKPSVPSGKNKPVQTLVYMYHSGTYGMGQVDMLRALSTESQLFLFRTAVQGRNSMGYQ